MIRLLINRKSIGGIIECGERDFDNKMTRFVPSRYARELKAFEALVRGRCLEMALQSNWVGHATLRVDPPPPLLLVRKPPVFSGTRSLYSPFLPSPPPPLSLCISFPFPAQPRAVFIVRVWHTVGGRHRPPPSPRNNNAPPLFSTLVLSLSFYHPPRAYDPLPPPPPVICLFVFFIEINTSFSALVRFPLNPIITILYLLTERRIVCIYLRLRNWIIELTVFIYDLVYRNDTSKKNVLSYDKIRRRKWCRGIVKSWWK